MEKWDVYDKYRNKTKKTIKAKNQLLDNQYRLIVHVVIFNSENQMLIQKRHPDKSLYPNKWDVTISGSAQANEDSKTAGERELLEELGYKLTLDNTRISVTFNFDEGFDDFFLIKKDIDIKNLTLETSEVVEVKWASKDEILKMLDQDIFLPYHKSVIEFLFFNKDNMRIHTK